MMMMMKGKCPADLHVPNSEKATEINKRRKQDSSGQS
jgi:hypothetical protein